MENIVNSLPILAVAMVLNVLFGIYNSIVNSDVKFDKTLLIKGVAKSILIGSGFIGLAFCFDRTDLSMLGIEPYAIMNMAIILYVSKFINNFAKVLGIDISNIVKK